MEEELVVLESGSTRSKVEERYDLIPPGPLRELALRYALGAQAHGEGNWMKGQPPSVVMNHMLRHLELYRSGDRSDKHMAAVAWGAFALMYFEEHNPELWEGDMFAPATEQHDNHVGDCIAYVTYGKSPRERLDDLLKAYREVREEKAKRRGVWERLQGWMKP